MTQGISLTAAVPGAAAISSTGCLGLSSSNIYSFSFLWASTSAAIA